MCKDCKYTNADPTRTETLREKYENDYRRRWEKVANEIEFSPIISSFVAGFASAQQLRAAIESSTSRNFLADNWEHKYSDQAYAAGAAQASVRIPEFPTIAAIDILQSPANQEPLRQSRLNHTASKEKNVAQTTDGMMDAANKAVLESAGKTPEEKTEAVAVAMREKTQATGATRSKSAASTLIIETHANATLDMYETAGIVSVIADIELVQFTTAGDGNVCPECESLSGVVFTVQEARGLIPVHVGCRCSWNPVRI